MKTTALTLVGTLCATSATLAGPLPKEMVGADAKWVLHLDVDRLLNTQVGQFLGDELFAPAFAKPARDLEQQFNVQFDWRKIHSLTAWGADFKPPGQPNGVLVIQSGLDVAKALDAVVEKLALVIGAGAAPLKKVDTDTATLYSLKDELYGTAPSAGLFLLSKSKPELEKARAVVAGDAPRLSATKSLAGLPDTPKSCFVLGAAEGFDKISWPAPAQGLKHVESGQLSAGEQDDNVFLRLDLTTKNKEAATQLQQIVQGFIALAALTQQDNKDVQRLAQNVKVTLNGQRVTLKLEMPAADVIARIKEHQDKRAAAAGQSAQAHRQQRRQPN